MITLFHYTKRKRSFRIKVMVSMQKLRRGLYIFNFFFYLYIRTKNIHTIYFIMVM